MQEICIRERRRCFDWYEAHCIIYCSPYIEKHAIYKWLFWIWFAVTTDCSNQINAICFLYQQLCSKLESRLWNAYNLRQNQDFRHSHSARRRRTWSLLFILFQALHMLQGDEQNKVLMDKIKARAKRVFELVDKNHDGQVTVDELVNVCMRNPDVYNMVVSTAKATPATRRK